MEAIAEFFVRLALTMLGLATNAGNLTAPYVQGAVNEAWRNNLEIPLSPELLATAVLKGWLTAGDGAAQAEDSGVAPSRFGVMVQTLGNPLPVEAGAEAVRRGLMDEARFVKLLRESRYSIDWADLFIALQYHRPSADAALHAAVTGHLDANGLLGVLLANGVQASDAQWLFDAAGRPPGTEQMIGLWRRQLVTEADVVTAIQESDIKPKYVPTILNLKEHIPPMRSVVQMIRKGVIDPATGAHYLDQLGFNAQVVAGLVAEATSDKTAAHRDVTESMIVAAYRVHQIDRGTAAGMLTALAYDGTEAEFILSLEDHKEAQAASDRAVNKVGTLYAAGRITRATAASDLSALGQPADAQSRLLAIWDLERAAKVVEPTVAQLGAMVKKSIITAAEMTARLVTFGYSPTDAANLVALY